MVEAGTKEDYLSDEAAVVVGEKKLSEIDSELAQRPKFERGKHPRVKQVLYSLAFPREWDIAARSRELAFPAVSAYFRELVRRDLTEKIL